MVASFGMSMAAWAEVRDGDDDDDVLAPDQEVQATFLLRSRWFR